MKMKMFFRWALLNCFIIHFSLTVCFALTDEEIRRFQASLIGRPVGEKIAFWAEQFVGTPYDPDPQGEYVTRAAIVADERVDCMYLTFRAVELALSRTSEEAVRVALEKRFRSGGALKDGKVVNYADRFEYGEDMIFSGKWGEEITARLGTTKRIKGSRGKPFVNILSSDSLMRGFKKLKSGDILFFIKKPEARRSGEIVGHIGIIKAESEVYLIHAGGVKGKGGMVRKVLLKEYLLSMPFIGAKVTRFE
jgi:hypothetical protein